MSGIPLHPEKGLNPKLVRCMQCGETMDDILLMGNKDYVTECRKCGIKLVGGGACPDCSSGGKKVYGVNKKSLDEAGMGMYIPGGPCEKCVELNRQTAEMVKEGGIYWKCKDCGSAGAIRAGHPLAEDVRTKMEIEAPNPCGIEFSKEEMCPVCSEDAVVGKESEEKGEEPSEGAPD